MKRKLSVLEHLILKKLEGEKVQFTFTAKVIGNFTLDEFKSAIAKVKNKHPLLSCHIETDKKGWTHFVSNDALEISVKVVNRLNEDDWVKEEWSELQTLFDLQHDSLARFVWVQGKGESEIICTTHHIIADARAAAFILRDVLYCLGDANYKLEQYKSLPGIGGLVPKKILFNPFFYLPVKFKALKMIVKIKLAQARPKKNPQARVFSDFSLLHWDLTQEATKVLSKKAKEQKVSIQSILHIVLLEAYSKTLGKKELPAYVKVPVDIRSKVSKELKSDSLGTCFAMPVNVTCNYKLRKDFWEMAKEVKEDLSRNMNFDTLYKDIAFVEFQKPILSYLTDSMLNANTDNISDLTLNNLGTYRIPLQYGHLKLQFLKVAAPVFGNHHILGAHVVAGQMNFTLITSKLKMDEDQAIQLRQQIMASLEKVLVERRGR